MYKTEDDFVKGQKTKIILIVIGIILLILNNI